jgi:hypothetical protein
MPDIKWTPSLIEERFVEAADVMKRLPNMRVPGYFNTWPKMLLEFADLVGQEPPRLRRPPPAPDAISRTEETLGWLRWLEADEARLIWMRAEGTPWRAICQRFGFARATAHRRWEYALCVIMWRLHGRPLPQKWSRRFLRERVRTLSGAA